MKVQGEADLQVSFNDIARTIRDSTGLVLDV